MIKLDTRLKAIIDNVSDNAYVADIGCDHGKVIVQLLLLGKAYKGIAVDRSLESLDKTRTLAKIYNVEDKIKCFCSNGLSDITSDVDTIIIAGMGALEIINIISKKRLDAKYILTPHQDTPKLRQYLLENGYSIDKDYIVKSNGKLYTIIVAKSGVNIYNRRWIYLGANVPRSNYFQEYVQKRSEFINKICVNIKKLSDDLAKELEEIKLMQEVRVKDIIKVIENFAPLSLQGEFDNSGFALGDRETSVNKVYVTLDTNKETILEAKEKGCNLIIEHHPTFFNTINSMDYNSYRVECIALAIKHDINIYSAHTSVDFTHNGLNDYVAELIGLTNIQRLIPEDAGSARVGELKIPISVKELAFSVGNILQDKNVKTIGDTEKQIKKVTIINGGGGNSVTTILDSIKAGADVFITADVKYNVARLIKDLGFSLISFGHYESEMPFLDLIKKVLENNFPLLEVIKTTKCSNPYN